MNRYFTIMAFLTLMGVGAVAQQYGDTIDFMPRQPGFYYDDWWADRWLDTATGYLQLAGNGEGFGEIYRYNYTEYPLTVIGIAVMPLLVAPGLRYVEGPMPRPDYLLLSEAYPDSFAIVASVPLDLMDSHYYAQLVTSKWGTINSVNPCCHIDDSEQVNTLSLYKYYFDKPVVVEDSFYVGYTTFTNQQVFGDDHRPDYYADTTLYVVELETPSLARGCGSHVSCRPVLHRYRLEYNRSGALTPPLVRTTRYLQKERYTLIFPLVLPDSCLSVRSLRVSTLEGRKARLEWTPDNAHVGWEVAWGLAGTPLDSCAVIFCDTPMVVLENIEADSHYVAYVRGVCHQFEITSYSEWSAGVDIYYRNSYRVEVMANDEERGQVSGSGEYYSGDEAVLRARPWAAYGFLQWDDGDTANPRRVVVTQDTTFTAIFVSREGVELADSADALVRLLPNPASGRVQVESAYRLERVELIDAQGRQVLTQKVEGYTTVMDLSRLAKGGYVVRVYTEQGLAFRRLLVE